MPFDSRIFSPNFELQNVVGVVLFVPLEIVFICAFRGNLLGVTGGGPL